MVDSSAIWKTNPDNSWRLYSHTDYKVPEPQQAAPKDLKEKKGTPQNKPQVPTPFSFTKSKPATKGSVTCTSKGYGVIQSFNEDKGTITVKIEGQAHEFAQDEVLSDIPLNVAFLDNQMKREEVVYMPITCTMNDFIERIESSLADGESSYSVILFSNGKEVSGSTDTLEKKKILPGTKFLGIVKPKKCLAVKRYMTHASGWGLNNGNIMALAFSPTKAIRVIGFGMYKPSIGTLNATANMYEGSRVVGATAVASKTVTIRESKNQDDIEKIMFNKSLLVKPGDYAVVAFTVTNQCTTHYGNGGKATGQGEGEVDFVFKICDDVPYLCGLDAGQLPEIYYYV